MEIKRIDEDSSSLIPLPTRATKGSAGLDLFLYKDISILPGEVKTIPTRLCIKIPKSHFGLLKIRSSLAQMNLTLLGGVLDSDYTKEVYVVIKNLGQGEIKLGKYSRFCQLLVLPYLHVDPVEVTHLEPTDSPSRTGGFGSR